MRPKSNSFPRQSRSKPPPRPPPPNQQPAFQSNPPPQNPPNMVQSSIPIPAQNGMFNPQAPIPFGNPNFPQFVNQAAFLSPPQQNSLLGVPQFGSMAPNLGFAPQLGFPPIQGQFTNPMQDVNQLNNALLQAQFIPQLLNLVLSQNMALQGQQPYFQNQMQNMGQFVPNQTPNPSQFGPHVAPLGFPSPNPLGNMQQSNQVAPGSSSNQNAADGNAQNSSLVGPSQGASSSANPPGKNPNLQSMPQGNQNSKNLQGRNAGRKASSGSQKPPQANNGKGKSRLANVQNEKGQGDNKAAKSSTAEPKRSIVFTYSEQEIKRWCDERRKNYPTKASVEKKLSGKIAEAEAAKAARREQLKEILAKQAELGLEVAEIPSTYLLDSEKKVQGEERETGGRFKKKAQGEERETGGRFQKKRNKRRRSNKNQNPNDSAPRSAPPPKKKKPTLLEKLLSADIRRDKTSLLQVFRFMVTNSFFQDPEKPLQYPVVDIEEDGPGPEEKYNELFEHISDHNNNEKDEEDDQNCENVVDSQEGEFTQVIDENEEEEGEIID